jgi:hypothetical protein
MSRAEQYKNFSKEFLIEHIVNLEVIRDEDIFALEEKLKVAVEALEKCRKKELVPYDVIDSAFEQIKAK